MNLFLTGWNLMPERVEDALAALQQLHEGYPQLDAATCRHWYFEAGGLFVATMGHGAEVAAPRRYVHEGPESLTFYDGIVYDRIGKFAAHKAAELERFWGQLPERLEGQFAVVRLDKRRPGLEIMTDLLGMVQVYYCRVGRTWLFSNSAAPLARLTGSQDFDPLGVSMFVSQTWVWDDRTLLRDVRTVPAAQLWTFSDGSYEPKRRTYCPMTALAPSRKKRLDRHALGALAEDWGRPLRRLEQIGPLQCSITGGRDSRVIMALLVRERLPVTFYTGGDVNSVDVIIGRRLARKLGVVHEVRRQSNDLMMERWDEVCRQLILQGDGMISLWQVTSVLNQPERVEQLPISFSGVIGGIARGNYYSPWDAMRRPGPDEAAERLIGRLVYAYGGLVLPEARQRAEEHIRKIVNDYFALGLSVHDVLDGFFAYQRGGRWAGCNRRRSGVSYDQVALFGDRSFVQAALTLPPEQRSCFWLHRRLVEELMPALAKEPYQAGRYRPGSPWLNILRWGGERLNRKLQRRLRRFRAASRKSGTEYSGGAWLEQKREWMRQICLDQYGSPLWDFVDRDRFDAVMSEAGDPVSRHAWRLGIFGIVTLFYYAETLRGDTANQRIKITR